MQSILEPEQLNGAAGRWRSGHHGESDTLIIGLCAGVNERPDAG
jgi:hypothetical protein